MNVAALMLELARHDPETLVVMRGPDHSYRKADRPEAARAEAYDERFQRLGEYYAGESEYPIIKVVVLG